MLQEVKVVLVELGSNLQGVYNYRPGGNTLFSINEQLEGKEEFFEVLFKFYAVHFRLSQEDRTRPYRAYYYHEKLQPSASLVERAMMD
ncbi:MAG: hypothetical protein WCS37_04320 [Chloroflexota bacterium]|nr:hypothetical protein [Chloroflexota bacterium]